MDIDLRTDELLHKSPNVEQVRQKSPDLFSVDDIIDVKISPDKNMNSSLVSSAIVYDEFVRKQKQFPIDNRI